MLRWRCKISIHAPSRERPPLSTVRGLRPRNFNPRSLTGATRMISVSGRWLLFQSTLPHGSDLLQHQYEDQKTPISIHAPSRERPKGKKFLFSQIRFQSTLPHGSDPLLPAAPSPVCHFNPRSLTGATRRKPGLQHARRHFNPRSLTGATDGSHGQQPSGLHFNPRSLTGATSKTAVLLISSWVFQSTLPHGSDRLEIRV